jgi:hypothetical protein
MSDWQPMKTAPIDGRMILATWIKEWKPGCVHIEVVVPTENGWSYAFDGDTPNNPPTHWMPLPNRPE